jgi:hypothetical protein
VDSVTLRLGVEPGVAVGAAEVLALIRRMSARGDDPLFDFRVCLSRADEANPSFEAVRYQEGSLVWDAVAQTGSLTLFADWKAIHGCSDWSCMGQQETRVEVRFDPGRRELVLSALKALEMPSTQDEF